MASTPNFPLQQAWQRTFAGELSYPLIAGGKVFVISSTSLPSGQTQLVAIDQATGLDAWPPVAIGSSYSAAHVYHQGRVVVIGSDGVLRSFDATSGTPDWTRLMHPESVPPSARDGKIYVANFTAIQVVDVRSGALVWISPTSAPQSLTLGGENVLITSEFDFISRSPTTGVERWRAPKAPSCCSESPLTAVYSAGRAYVRGLAYSTYSPSLLVRDAETGAEAGTANVVGFGPLSIPAVAPDAAYVVNGGKLQRFVPLLQTVVWTFAGDGSLVSAPLVVGNVVFIGSSSGRLYAVDAASGAERWSTVLPAAMEWSNDLGVSLPVKGMAAANGVLVVPAGQTLSAWRLSPS